MRQSHVSTTTFSLQDGEQDSSVNSMQEVEASTLEIGIAQGIDDSSSSNESLVLVPLLSSLDFSSSHSSLSKLNLHNKYSQFVARVALRSLRALSS
jgi:hypothetical protein